MGLALLAVYFAIAVIAISYFLINQWYLFWKKRAVPYVEPLFPHGNFKNAGESVHVCSAIVPLYEQLKDKAPFCGIYLFVDAVALPTNLDLIRNILTKDLKYFAVRGFLYSENERNRFHLDHKKCHRMQNKLTDTFASHGMRSMTSVVVDVVKQLEEVFAKSIIEGPEVDVSDIVGRFSADVAARCAFGNETNSLKDFDEEFWIKTKKLSPENRNNWITEELLTLYPNLTGLLGVEQFPKDVLEYFIKTAKEAVGVAKRENNNVHQIEFLDCLLSFANDSKDFTMDEIASQAFLFFYECFKASSLVLSWCLYELALDQNVQEKLRDEIGKVHRQNTVPYDSVVENSYMERVINETLRKYPPVPYFFLKATDEYRIPNSFRKIDKGMTLLIPTHAIQMDPEIYSDPDVFDPERFSPTNVKKRHPYTFLPFGDKSSNSVGVTFARKEFTITLARLLNRFKFSVTAKTEAPIKMDEKQTSLTPKQPIILNVVRVS